MELKERIKRFYGSIVPYQLRLGSDFRTLHRFLRESENWSLDQIHAYQLRKLKEIVRTANQQAAGYQRKFAEYGVDPDVVESLDDIAKLPMLTKEDLRRDSESFLCNAFPKDALRRYMTGGSTGMPVSFFHLSRYSDSVFNAFRVHMWQEIGYTPLHRALDLTWNFEGTKLRYNPDFNWISLSISSLDRESISIVVDEITKFRPRFVIGYPSTVVLFAQLTKELNVGWPDIKGILLGSEMLYEPQRALISSVFPAAMIQQWYGMSELAGFACTCTRSSAFHFFPQAGYTELVDEAGKVVTRQGEEGEIVLTGFFTTATPFIRYRTGDRGVFQSTSCYACGKDFLTISRIVGRDQDYLIGKYGRKLPMSAINTHRTLFHGVRIYQFHQETKGKVNLRIVKEPFYDDLATDRIETFLRRTLGRDFEITLTFVNDIPRTSRGKHKFLVQDIQ